MPLVKVNDLLKHATEHKYGVPAVNQFTFESIKYAIKAAEIEKLPIIIQYFPGLTRHMDNKYAAFIAKDLAEKASVPVAVHLDHSHNLDIAVGGIRDGYPSVMVDGSSRSFEENVALTKSVVDVARVFNVDVEAELGHVGSGASEDDIFNTDHYTNVDQAVKFVELTGCNSLAVAVGNAHGAYVKTPKLDFDRITALHEALPIPLVLHGCSDIPDDQIQEAVNRGMSKFNIATEYDRAFFYALKNTDFDAFENATPYKQDSGRAVMMDIEEQMVEFVRSKFRLLNPNKFSL